MVPLFLYEFVLLKSCQVESEQQKLQDLNQEHTQNLLVSDYTAHFTQLIVLSTFRPLMTPARPGDFLWSHPGEPNNR